MKRSTATLLTIASLFVGVAIGAFGGYRYAEDHFGRYLLTSINEDARIGLVRYERMKRLIESNDDEKLLNYLDLLMHLESTLLKSTQDVGSTSQDPRTNASAESDL